MQPVLCGLSRTLASSLLASCLHAPLAWSPDGQWLAFTSSQGTAESSRASGWLFDVRRPSTEVGDDHQGGEGPAAFRIWATERATLSSVLIEDSEGPLSSPTWSPDGHSLAYLRFVHAKPLLDLASARGTCELVVQEAIDRKRVVASFKDVELDREERKRFPESTAAWSPDGRLLAVSRPGRLPSVMIVRVDRGTIVRTIESATRPSWSPDGTKLAFFRVGRGRPGGLSLHAIDLDSVPGRPLLELCEATESPVWSPDGLSLVAICRRPGVRGREIDLVRVTVDTGFATRLLQLATVGADFASRRRPLTLGEVGHDGAAVHRASLSCDREGEEFVLSIDLDGQIPVLRYGSLRRGMIFKPFHPLDISHRIGSLSLAPDSQVVAVRIDTAEGQGLPLLCELGSEKVKLIAPGRQSGLNWVATLLGTSRSLLSMALPQAMLDGKKVERATLLPIAGEIPDQSPLLPRLRRLGTIGISLLDRPRGEATSSSGPDVANDVPEEEYRFFFEYLRGNFAAAASQLEVLESRAATAQMRLKLLGLRAQVLDASGQAELAQTMTDYMLKVQGTRRSVIEPTPAGFTLTRADDPDLSWPRYLKHAMKVKGQQGPTLTDEPGDAMEDLMQRLPRRGVGLFGGQTPAGDNRPHFRLGEIPEGFIPGLHNGPFDPAPRPRAFPPQPPRPPAPALPR